MPVADHELSPEQLRKRSDPEQFPFETTADVSPLEEIIGQERGVRAIRFGLDIQSPGYNVFVAGLSGTGKGSIVRRFLTKLSAAEPVPADGVYVSCTEIDGRRFEGCTNIGVRPTFDGMKRLVETHLLDFEGDVYGRVATIELLRRLRPEQKFEGADALIAQIQRDVAAARAYFA